MIDLNDPRLISQAGADFNVFIAVVLTASESGVSRGNISEISRLSGSRRKRVYRSLKRLQFKGLINVRNGDGGIWVLVGGVSKRPTSEEGGESKRPTSDYEGGSKGHTLPEEGGSKRHTSESGEGGEAMYNIHPPSEGVCPGAHTYTRTRVREEEPSSPIPQPPVEMSKEERDRRADEYIRRWCDELNVACPPNPTGTRQAISDLFLVHNPIHIEAGFGDMVFKFNQNNDKPRRFSTLLNFVETASASYEQRKRSGGRTGQNQPYRGGPIAGHTPDPNRKIRDLSKDSLPAQTPEQREKARRYLEKLLSERDAEVAA